MKKVVIVSNHHAYTYNFRKEIIQRFIDENYKVYVVLPYGEKIELLKEMGCEHIDLPLDRRGINPVTDFKLILGYFKTIRKVNPDLIVSYTIKPNLYAGFVSRILKIPFFPNITGLGSAVESKSVIQKVITNLYKVSLKKASCIFFQNKENKDFFKENIFNPEKYKVIPGSGVNVDKFSLLPYPAERDIEFVFISRIMKEKGIDQYIEAAQYITDKYPNTKFHVCGFCEEEYEEILKDLQKKNILTYHGMVDNVHDILRKVHCTVHPTYYPEGMSNVLLESSASGRPLIATDRSGCREIIDEGVNGFLVEQENSKDLIKKIEMFLDLPYEQKKEMGLAGRKKIEEEFDRKLVVDAYFDEINKVDTISDADRVILSDS